MMSEAIFTSEEEKAVEALAQRRGFAELREYVRMLVEADAQQHGEVVLLTHNDDAAESFRRGWEDAMEGRTMTREEFRRRMLSDAD